MLTARLPIALGAVLILSGCELGVDREALLQIYSPQRSEVRRSAPPAAPAASAAPRYSSSGAGEPGEGHAAAGTPGPPGEKCSGTDSRSFCLGLKYVVYADANGDPVESEKETLRNLEETNQIWAPCGIQFQIDQYRIEKPARLALRFRPANFGELTRIRNAFADVERFLIVKTGSWDRTGSLGNTAANAWTNLPGEETYGAVLERDAGESSSMLAHELGHYLSLDHVENRSDLMNPVLFSYSRDLTRGQCRAARAAVREFWHKMLR